jgi:2-C-methyl-D-erythritol 4-phosphate cytidylyltransferase
MKDVAVILPAAGSGKRFGSTENKIFQPLAGRPIFLRTCDAFARRDDVAIILLVASPSDMPRLEDRFGPELETLGVRIVAGGPVRTESVRNALDHVPPQAALTAVHDAVRPCVAQPWLDAVFDEARATGAAMLAWPEHATLKYVDESGVIRRTVDRSNIWQAQTPQVFRTDWLIEAYAAASEAATDDAGLVEAAGHHVRVVTGDPRNLKITTPADLVLAEALYPTLESGGAR